jgi:hypothetical protein
LIFETLLAPQKSAGNHYFYMILKELKKLFFEECIPLLYFSKPSFAGGGGCAPAARKTGMYSSLSASCVIFLNLIGQRHERSQHHSLNGMYSIF